MSGILVLEGVELIPVLELAPFDFGAEGRPMPSSNYQDMPEEWHRYWLASLADGGITGLMPVQQGSWHVPTREFSDRANLRRVLELIFQKRAETDAAPDWGPLNGGLALRCQSRNVLIEPGCCADLGDVANWRQVVGCRQAEWQTLWIGHPWLSVRYDAPRLIVSDPHEGESPTPRWAVCPDQLQAALVAAEGELERFAGQIEGALPADDAAGSREMSHKLAGIGH